MSERRINDHVQALLREATRAFNRGDVNKLRDIAEALKQMSQVEAAKATEDKIRRLANSWAVTN